MEPSLFRYIWRHSRGEQVFVLSLILLSLPFYFASFDVPKRIINDALQGRAFAGGQTTVNFFKIELGLPDFLGGASMRLFDGFQVDRMQLLFGLSFFFLSLVVVNGAFKYAINVRKGILGERMLRRIRYELFALLMKFRPESIRAVRPAEAASIIKDEVEPIGGFAGDAFIQPAFLGMQAFTAMLFIMVQSVWLGMVALSIVLVQAFVIPRLRREQLRLARERQIASRKLAGRIGEIIEAAPALHVHGTVSFTRSEIGRRLGELFKIRVDLFRRKFAVKYLNNFLAQITPFFFYAIGGYLALKGSIDIGQLVAVIAAYRDLPPPIKELIDWDQERADVTIKYQQIVAQFPSDQIVRESADAEHPPDAHGPIRIDGLRVVDSRGTALLDSLSVTIPRPSHVALVGAGGSGRDIVTKVLGRQLTGYQGKVLVDGQVLQGMSDNTASRAISYVGPEPLLSSGTIRDNVSYSLRRREPPQSDAPSERAERERRLEAVLSGNPVVVESDEWLDLESIGIKGSSELDAEIMRLLKISGFGGEVYRLGLLGRIDVARERETAARLLEARTEFAERIAGDGRMKKLIAPFDPDAFNPHATIAENLLFGLPTNDRFCDQNLAVDTYARSIIEAEALLIPLVQIGLRMAETVMEVFADLPPGHPLFERFSFIRQDELQDFQRVVEQARQVKGLQNLAIGSQARLIGLALSYVEPRHRLQLVDERLRTRILRARRSFQAYLPAQFADDVEFYDPARYNSAASIRDNLLFGRVAHEAANAEGRVYEMLNTTLRELDLERVIHRLGLDFEVGPGGKLLFAPQRSSIALARGLIARPDAIVLDEALGAFGVAEAREILTGIRAELEERTLIVTLGNAADAEDFDTILTFEGPRCLLDPSATGSTASRERGRSGQPTAEATA